jgi:hypothetical protein
MDMDTDEASGASQLKRLPLEVLLRITHLLPTTDLCSLRLSCRPIEQMLYNDFAKEFFSCKQFMFSVFSLQALIDISKSRLGPTLRRLQIGLDTVVDPARPGYRIPNVEVYAEQVLLWTTGLGSDMLAQAMANLINLAEVVLRDNNSRKRNRDGLGHSWNSYGVKQIVPAASSDTLMRNAKPDFAMGSFFALLMASAKSGVKLSGVELLMRTSPLMFEHSYYIASPLKPSLLPVLQGLEKLHLSVDFTKPVPQQNFHLREPDISDGALNIRRFLTYTPNLKDLRINEWGSYTRGSIALMRWLAEPAPHGRPDSDDSDPIPIALPRLEKLSLGRLQEEEKTLVKMAKKFAPTLKSLELWAVTLLWDTSPDTVDNANGRTWKSLLGQLIRIEDLNLHHIMIGNPNEDRLHNGRPPQSTRWFHHVQLNPTSSTGKYVHNIISYTGIDWKHFIQQSIGKISSDFDPTNLSDEDIHYDQDVDDDDEEDDDEDDSGEEDE